MLRFVLLFIVFIWTFCCIECDGGIPSECLRYLNSSLHDGQVINRTFYNGDYDYGHVEVRAGASLFYWLYYAAGDKTSAYDKPLIIWIQGGPGIPASGVGNFEEIGPQDIYLNNRTTSWVKKRNVIFIDSPVGTGFSFVTNSSLLVKSDKEIAIDLVELMKQFLEKFSGFKTVPTHIFSQSYGAKIAPIFAYHLHKAIERNEMSMNLKTLAMGNVYVPRHSTKAFPMYLQSMGLTDSIMYEELINKSLEVVQALDDGQYEKAVDMRNQLLRNTFGGLPINVHNLFSVNTFFENNHYEQWFKFMNETVKNILFDIVPENLKSYLDFQDNILDAVKGDIMKSPSDIVEKLLNETELNILFYNGVLDILSPVAGTLEWVNNFNWTGSHEFRNAQRLQIPGNNGLYKIHERLGFWWIYNAGLSVQGNPAAMEHILNVSDSLQTKKEIDRTRMNTTE